MSLEVVRGEDGKLESGSVLNPEGTNQWSPGVRAKRRLDAAVLRHTTPQCADSFGKRVAKALEEPADEKNLNLLKYALPAASKLDVGLSGPGGGPVEIAGPERLEAISASFVSRFTPDPDVGEEDPDGSGTGGAG